MKKIIVLSLLAMCGALLICSYLYADTIRVYKAPGEGYTEITTNDNGDKVGESNFSEEGVVKDSTEYDLESGNTIKTEYEDGKPVKRTTTNKEGNVIKEELFDGEGRVEEETTYAGGNPFEGKTKRFERDEKGRITKIDKLGGMDGGVRETTTYEYDGKGRLRKVSRHRSTVSGGAEMDFTGYDEEGNVTESSGVTEGIVDEKVKEEIREAKGIDPAEADPNTHVTRDHLGNKVKVTHNSDGSFDIEVRDMYGRLLSLQHLSPGPCYLGDDCPFKNKVMAPQSR